MQTDDEEGGGGSNTSPPNSQTSSVDGVASGPDAGKSSHPFRIIEHDALSLQSMTSLGRVGRILSGLQDAGNKNSFKYILIIYYCFRVINNNSVISWDSFHSVCAMQFSTSPVQYSTTP